MCRFLDMCVNKYSGDEFMFTLGNFRLQGYISKFDTVNYTNNTLKKIVVFFYMFCDLDYFMLINYSFSISVCFFIYVSYMSFRLESLSYKSSI